MKWLVGIGILIGVLVGLYYFQYPNYTYRYRLTVNIEVDGKNRSGASVIEVTWHGGPEIGDVGRYTPTMKGEAALIDLEDRGVVIATMINGEDYGRARDGALGALWIAPLAFGFGTSVSEMPRFLKERGKRDIALKDLPRILWFSNPQDPTTAKKLSVQDIPIIFGPSARFAGASVEITSDPLVVDIRQKLPWLKPLGNKPPGSNVIYLPNGLAISRYMFVGDAS